MILSAPYAVVADPETMADLLGLSVYFRYGVCLVRDGSCECHYPADMTAVMHVIGNLPAVPYGFSATMAQTTVQDELEALRHIAAEAPPMPFSSSLPHGFYPAGPMHAVGLSYRHGLVGVELRVHCDTARLLVWPEGSSLMIGISTCGTRIAIAPSESGSFRLECAQPESSWLGSDREVPGLDCLPAASEWRALPFRIVEGVIVCPVPPAIHPVMEPLPPVETGPKKVNTAMFPTAWSITVAVLVGFIMGALVI